MELGLFFFVKLRMDKLNSFGVPAFANSGCLWISSIVIQV